MPNRNHALDRAPSDTHARGDWDDVSDNPPLTDEELASARRGPEGLPPALAAAFAKRAGRPKAVDKAVPVSLRVPPDVLAAYKAEGPGWQTRMNEALAVAPDGPKRRRARRATAANPECAPQADAEMKSKVVAFVKFFSEEEHADQFIAGKLFMRRLRYFQRLENKGTDDERPDANEAVVSWHQPDRVELTLNFPGFDPITIGKDDLAGPVSTTRHFYSEMHIFCMTALSMLNPAFLQGTHEEIEAQVQAAARVDERCLDFGPHAVVVRSGPFASQLRRALGGSEYWYHADLVTYYDEQAFHGAFEEAKVPFMKQSRFAHQNEYRVCIQTPTPGDDPLMFDIGDMSGFAHKIRSADLNPGLQVTLRRPPGSSVVEQGAGNASAPT